MILFLDFDGVLHPQYENQTVPVDVAFCHLARFEAVMREFPAVEIVISSTWREQFSLDNLRSRFSSDIATRITGTTLLPKDQVVPRLVELREWEIVTWLTVQGRCDEPWIALDDAAWQFKHHRNHLVSCTGYVGFDAIAEQRLRAALMNA
jgi:HAD domain in Swiss Army Knife RNA repair proteins